MFKEKGKASDDDEEEYEPVITYRHVISQNLGVHNPLRVIALCDMDAYYAACEMVRLGVDPELPLVVQQWNMLIAVNYPARKFGISRMDNVTEAKKRCPDLIVVHVATFKDGEKEPGYHPNPNTMTHKVSLDYYRRESAKILHVFKDMLPTTEIAFFDFTVPVRELLLSRYPYLADIPATGLDSPLPPPVPISWDGVGNLIPIDPSAEDHASCQDSPSNKAPITWHDVALSIAAELMQKTRQEVLTKLGYSTSAGIARNKFLAKLAASYRKPNNQSILRNAAIPNYLNPIAFQKIRFLGGKLGAAIAEEYDAKTVSDLRSIELAEMQAKLGPESIWVYQVLRGIDFTEVKAKAANTKSMLASKNLSQPITSVSDPLADHWLKVLGSELSLRLTEARLESPTLWPKSLVLHIRPRGEAARSKQGAFPFVRDLNDAVIFSMAQKLWKELAGLNSFRVTTISLAFSGIESLGTGQRSIEEFLNGMSPTKRVKDEAELSDEQSPAAYICPRCGARIRPTVESGLGEEEQVTIMATARMEHEDFHLAQDLSRNPENQLPDANTSRPKKKIKSRPRGIEKYFEKKS